MKLPKPLRLTLSLLCGAGLLLISACGKKESAVEPVTDNKVKEEAQAFYDAHPEFFHTRTVADIPADLKWENGADLPEIGSPHAKKGGTVNYWMQDSPARYGLSAPMPTVASAPGFWTTM